jgi:hypothetical protein
MNEISDVRVLTGYTAHLISILQTETRWSKCREQPDEEIQAASSQYSSMSEERIGDKFLRKLYEKTVDNGIESIDRNEIGIEFGMIDIQMDNLVDELTSDGYLKKVGRTKIYLTDDGRKRAEI